LAYWIDYGFSYVDSQAAFRAPIGIQLVFAVIVTFLVFGLPESPRYDVPIIAFVRASIDHLNPRMQMVGETWTRTRSYRGPLHGV
jgi:hypothetical protein